MDFLRLEQFFFSQYRLRVDDVIGAIFALYRSQLWRLNAEKDLVTQYGTSLADQVIIDPMLAVLWLSINRKATDNISCDV